MSPDLRKPNKSAGFSHVISYLTSVTTSGFCAQI